LNDLPKFLFYSINSYLINRQMRKRSNGTSQLQLIRKDVDNVRLQIPSLPEQQKIAEFLSSVDELIESKQKQITQAEEWKKGLMQGLFV
jgi:type I restriction enzyme S subunit